MMTASGSHDDDVGPVVATTPSPPKSPPGKRSELRRSSLPPPTKPQSTSPRLGHGRSRSLAVETTMLGGGGDIGLRGDDEEASVPLTGKGKGRAVEENGHALEEAEEEVDEEAEERRIQAHLRRLAAREEARRRSARQSATFVLLPSAPDVDMPSIGEGLTTLGRRGSQLARRGSKMIRHGSVREDRRGARRIRDGSGEGANALGGRAYEDLEEVEEVEMVDSPRSPRSPRDDIYDAVRITAPERPATVRQESFATLQPIDSTPNWELLHPRRTREEYVPPRPPQRLGFFDWLLCGCWMPEEDDSQAGRTMPDTIPAD